MAAQGARFEDWRNLTAGIASLATVAGLAVGAWWAFFRFRGGREDSPVVVFDVRAEIVSVGYNQMVWCLVSLRNAGRKMLHLVPHDESILGIEWFRAEDLPPYAEAPLSAPGRTRRRQVGEVWWEDAPARVVPFATTASDVGPGDSLRREVLFVLPEDETAFVLRLSAKAVARRRFGSDVSWVAETVVLPTAKDINAERATEPKASGAP